jgi:saccharopine dehydrogenase-like NADP-dependent oxidoreductase
MKNLPVKTIRVGVLGFGGLGQAAARMLETKGEMILVAAADQHGYAYNENGLNVDQAIATYSSQGSIGYLEGDGCLSNNSIGELLKKTAVDGYFLALPNLPNTFMAEVAKQFIESGWKGVLVDALKRTSAMEQIFTLKEDLQKAGITYMTGCGATPGLLTAAAVVAAQSYGEIHSVKITFGVGIANWEAYRATIREDIAHLPGYDVETARQMSDAEVEALLDKTNGILTLEGM